MSETKHKENFQMWHDTGKSYFEIFHQHEMLHTLLFWHKRKVLPIQAMKAYKGTEIQFHLFLILALNGSE
jgi:hypothetical protein